MAKFKLILAMFVLAIFAVGAVSAAEDIAIEDNIIESADDIEIEDVPAEEDVEEDCGCVVSTTYTLNVDTNSNFTDINAKISDGTYSGYEFVFANDTYTNFAMVTGNNNKFTGNGATIIGGTDNLFTVAGSSNIVINGFIMQTATGKAAVYGANVFNACIVNNTISGGKDGINIMQTYDNVTICSNTITGFTRDGISLVDHRTFDDLSSKGYSIICNNVITGISYEDTEVGMFFGGNFKGNITGNIITNVATGVDFTGKRAATNGRLYANFYNNNISNVDCGIYMNNPHVDFLNITYCNIGLNSSEITNAIFSTTYFNCTGYIGVYYSNFTGNITDAFVTAVGSHKDGNSGFP